MKRFAAIFSLCCGLLLSAAAQESRNIDLQPFTDLELEGVFDVELIQGSANRVDISAPAEYIDLVTVEQSGDRVEIGMEKNRRFKKIRDIKVKVYLSDLRRLETSMVGNLTSTQTLRLDELRVESSMVGDVSLNLEVGELEYHSSSVGDTRLAGTATVAEFENSSVGDFSARELKSRRISVENSSVGNFEAYASEEVAVENSGVGRVYITGGAKATRLDNSGIGKVRIE